MAALLMLSSATAAKPSRATAQPAGPHGLPLLPSGEHLTLDAPGWTRGIGTWKAASGPRPPRSAATSPGRALSEARPSSN